MAIITLQANRPETKAAAKPRMRASGATPAPKASWPVATFSRSSDCSPMMGMRTIRKENWAIDSRLTPERRPVAMVLPLREMPGATANACATPTIAAWQKEMPLRA